MSEELKKDGVEPATEKELDAATLDAAITDQAGGEPVGGEALAEQASTEQASTEQASTEQASTEQASDSGPVGREQCEAAADPEAELATLVDSLARGNARSADCERWVYSRYGIDPHLPTVEKIRLLRRV